MDAGELNGSLSGPDIAGVAALHGAFRWLAQSMIRRELHCVSRPYLDVTSVRKTAFDSAESTGIARVQDPPIRPQTAKRSARAEICRMAGMADVLAESLGKPVA